MVKTEAACLCLFLVCLSLPLQTLMAEEAVAASTGAENAAAEISAKLKQSEDEITRLKNELKGLKTKESSFAEQSAKLSSQLDAAKKQAEAAAAQAEQAKQAKEKAEKELAQLKSEEAARTKELQLKNAELEAALKSAQEASLVLKNEAKDAKNLKEAKEKLEARVTELTGKVAAAKESHSSEQRKLEAELESLKAKLEKERETQKLVVQLRKEKVELQNKVTEAKDSICHKAHDEWIPLAKETIGAHLGSVKEVVEGAVSAVEEASLKAADSEHAKTVRAAVRPHLVSVHAAASKIIRGQLLEKSKSPLDALRELAKAAAVELGAPKKYQDAAVAISDYWLVVVPLFLAGSLVVLRWLSESLRHTGLRVQQWLLALSLAVAAAAFVHETDAFELLGHTFDKTSLTIVHGLVSVWYALAALPYALAVVLGPRRFLAAVQLAAVAWVGYAYCAAAVLHAPAPGPSFMRAHLFRSLAAIIVALWGHGPRALRTKARAAAAAPPGPKRGGTPAVPPTGKATGAQLNATAASTAQRNSAAKR